jgi:orotate phosphoribosyltransferase
MAAGDSAAAGIAAAGIANRALTRYKKFDQAMAVRDNTAMASSLSRQQLTARIAEVALLRGTFTLRSGRTSNYYFDKYLFETQPDILRELGVLLAGHVTPETDRIAGPELGAVALAASASLASGKPFVLIRNQKKEYSTGKQIEGQLLPGETVLLVEDILTTGGQVLEAAKALVAAGAKVQKIVGIIDRLEGARQNIESAGFVLESLFTTKELGL